MGRYLTEEQITRAREELTFLYALPYAADLVGTAWEQILADLKGGTWSGIRDNRPRPDVVVSHSRGTTNYAVKIEGLRTTRHRAAARDFLGHTEDLIVARPQVDRLLEPGQSVADLDANSLGNKVLEYYNGEIVKRYGWDVISILLRIGTTEFIYWELAPAPIYDPADYWWRDSGRATGGNRNINGYPRTIGVSSMALPRAKFKWTSGGKQFYVLYEIPTDADTWVIKPVNLTHEDVRTALRELLRRKGRIAGNPSAT